MADGLPDILLVGAMKAGTTTLYFDLDSSPSIHMGDTKEPGALADPDVVTPAGRAAYAEHYRGASAGQLLGDASTVYTQVDNVEAVAQRARAVVGDATVLYLVRDPIARIVSHYRHWVMIGSEQRRLGDAVRADARYVAWSSYGRQFEPWRRAYADRCLAIEFEEFVRDREAVLDRVAEHVGVPRFSHEVDPGRIDNATEERRALGAIARHVRSSTAYQRLLRPLTTATARRALSRVVLRRAEAPEVAMDHATLSWLLERIAPDLARHEGVLGLAPWSTEDLWAAHATDGAAG